MIFICLLLKKNINVEENENMRIQEILARRAFKALQKYQIERIIKCTCKTLGLQVIITY